MFRSPMCGALAVAVCAGAPVARADDFATGLDRIRIPNGPFAGGYTLMLNDTRLNWYFCNLGLWPVAGPRRAAVREYLDLYLKSTDPKTGTIDDYDVKTGRRTTSDSDDAYAATFLSLAVRYYEETGDKKWWAANAGRLKQIAKRVLVDEQKTSGLINTFVKNRDFANDPTGAKKDYQPIGQLMDNCEVYRGLADLARGLGRDDPDAAAFRDCAAKVARGIDELYDSDKRAFRPNDAVAVAAGPFYPHRAAQAFPELYGVPLTDQQKKYDAAWAYLNGRKGDDWTSGKYDDPSTGGFPWMTLGYAAAKRGGESELKRARSQLQYFQTEYQRKAPAAQFTAVQELGFALRAEQQLRGK